MNHHGFCSRSSAAALFMQLNLHGTCMYLNRQTCCYVANVEFGTERFSGIGMLQVIYLSLFSSNNLQNEFVTSQSGIMGNVSRISTLVSEQIKTSLHIHRNVLF